MRSRGSYRHLFEDKEEVREEVNDDIKNIKEEVDVIDVIEDMDDTEVMEVVEMGNNDHNRKHSLNPNHNHNPNHKPIHEKNDRNKRHIVSKKRKSLENDFIKVITLESDGEVEEDIQTIDSDYGSSVSVVEEITIIPVKRHQKRCDKCLEVLPTPTCATSPNNYDYNRLTSADFYLNPRIHSSVISVELKDKNRFKCFDESIIENKHLFKDKSVLVIGSGNGVLALFVAKALAKTVYVFDRTGIQEIIESVINTNRRKLPNNRTKFVIIREKISEMVLSEKVDIIVSDWANHSLFYKSMFDTFITARDKWLKKDGLLFPDSALMYLCGAQDLIHFHNRKDKKYSDSNYVKHIEYWDTKLYGFDMTAVRQRVIAEPIHEGISGSQVISNEDFLKKFDFYNMSFEDMNFSSKFNLNVLQNDYLQTFVLLFDVIFSKTRTVSRMYSTRPSAPKNMFRPTVFFIESEKQQIVFKDDEINGIFRYSLSPDLNRLSVEIDFRLKNKCSNSREQLVFTV